MAGSRTVTTTTLTPATKRILGRYGRSAAPSARVLLTTIFGDALLPRGQSIAVQSLAALALPLGVNERGVRTALQRLSTERIVEAERVGRRSFYRVHPDSVTTFENANRRIYRRPDPAWDGQWTIAVLDRTSPDGADDGRGLIQQLQWLGMAPIAPGVFVSALLAPDEVAEAAGDGGGLIAVSRGPLTTGTLLGDEGRRHLVDPDGDLDKRYRRHLSTFDRAVAMADSAAADVAPLDAFVVRTLVVDSWRRIALRAAEIPPVLEPSDWPAAAAFDLTASLLARLRPASEAHLDEVLGAD